MIPESPSLCVVSQAHCPSFSVVEGGPTKMRSNSGLNSLIDDPLKYVKAGERCVRLHNQLCVSSIVQIRRITDQ
ncbi:hypothetical protein Scep_006671 [Stephania cephalantha]|uniref:Uncharacterized protein n=1 Tax=Stephania cephalantha TaxID=152367 RepID=A0AAP0K9Z1_9MAGN